MQADIYGLKLYHMEDSESTALGALMTVLTEMGVYSSVEEAFHIIRGAENTQVFKPRMTRFEEYQKKKERCRNYIKRYIDDKEHDQGLNMPRIACQGGDR